MTKLRLITRKTTVEVHAFDCADFGRGLESVCEASNAEEVVWAAWATDPNVWPLKAWQRTLFFGCVRLGDANDGDQEDTGPTPPKMSPGMSVDQKINLLTEWAEEYGWDWRDSGSSVEFLRSDDEVLVAVFTGAKWVPDRSSYSYAGVTEPVRSLDLAFRRLSAAAGEAIRVEKRRTKRSLPFDPEEADEVEIIAACMGRRVTWTNLISGMEETARLYPDGRNPETGVRYNKHTRIELTAAGRRVLTFCEDGGGFRSVAVDQMLAVR